MNKPLEFTRNHLRRLGLSARALSTPSVTIGGRRLTASRVTIDSLPWLHIGVSSSATVTATLREVTLVAALADRIPVCVGVNRSAGEISSVVMSPWAFAALLRMAQCLDPSQTQTVLNEYLPLGTQIPPTDRTIGSSILQALEGASDEPSSTST